MRSVINKIILLASIICCILFLGCNNKKKPADVIYINAGAVYTADEKLTIAECFAVNKGKFIAIGKKDEILSKFISSKIIDLQGRFVYPGLIDGHSHFLNYGIYLQKSDLTKANSFNEVLEILVKYQKTNQSNWILGWGWDQNKWTDKTLPDNRKLDELFPYLPVVLTRIDDHAVLANSLAIKKAGITKDMKIEGGRIILRNGKLTGLFLNKAAEILKERFSHTDYNKTKKAFLEAQDSCLAAGITTVTDAGLDKRDIDIIDTLQAQGKLKIRIYAIINATENNLNYYFNTGTYKTRLLEVRAVKLYSDGALGSGGALLLKPYSDEPNNYGLQISSLKKLREICQKAYDMGFQVCTHAIGDSAVRTILNIYSGILKDYNGRRWRIEHAQVVHPDDLLHFKRYSIIPSVQTCHATSDMNWAIHRLGPARIKTAYVFKQLQLQNGWLINGTDFPVENISPILNFYAAVSRKDLNGFPAEGFQKENCLSRIEALNAMTIWAAKGCFGENEKGSIEPGKEADFIITNKDFMKVPENEIPFVKVTATYISGEKVFQNNNYR